MRNLINIQMLLLCLLSAGCGREAATDKDVSTMGTNSAEVEAPVEARSPRDVVLADGYMPRFAHVLRSQRHEESGSGTFRHFVIVEYLDADRETVVRILQAGLKSQGFTIQGPVASEVSSRLSARKGSLKFVMVVNDSTSLVFNDPRARGVVHFSWQDRSAR